MRRLTLVVILGFMSYHAQAEVYKCTQNGKTVFADQPCSSSAQKISVKPASGTNAPATENASAESRAYVAKANLNTKKRELDEDISRSENRITRLHRERDSKLAQLQDRKTHANNNLAGAVWEDSISKEMVAISDSYGSKISSEEKILEDLKKKRAELD